MINVNIEMEMEDLEFESGLGRQKWKSRMARLEVYHKNCIRMVVEGRGTLMEY